MTLPLPPLGAQFRGPVAAVILDWAGTVLDFGCVAPVAAFRGAFAEGGLPISEAEAREPMGTAKREHVERILAQPAVRRRWEATMGALPTEADVDRLYAIFLRIDGENCARYSALIPGVLDTIATLRERGVAIGSTTGYPRSIMDGLAPRAAAQGYRPDCCVTVSDVARGRPWPDMVLANALALGAPDMRACVAVDDSPSGLVSARAAGAWAVGVAVSGNEVGLSLEVWEGLTDMAKARLRAAAVQTLEAAGAHYVIDSIADLPPVIEAIDARLAAGERP